jgi:hypothetical protein
VNSRSAISGVSTRCSDESPTAERAPRRGPIELQLTNIGLAIELWASWLGRRVEFISDMTWDEQAEDDEIAVLDWPLAVGDVLIFRLTGYDRFSSGMLYSNAERWREYFERIA